MRKTRLPPLRWLGQRIAFKNAAHYRHAGLFADQRGQGHLMVADAFHPGGDELVPGRAAGQGFEIAGRLVFQGNLRSEPRYLALVAALQCVHAKSLSQYNPFPFQLPLSSVADAVARNLRRFSDVFQNFFPTSLIR